MVPHALLRALLLIPFVSGCAVFAPQPLARTLDTRTGLELEMSELADRLAPFDVVFLGEVHNSTPVHELQNELFRELHARRGDVVLSLEMFEADVQAELDAYLARESDEEAFLAAARPWPNYEDDYRPSVEYARDHGLAVVAANVPRKLASRVAKEGLDAVREEEHMPADVSVAPGRYRELFEEAMAEHDGLEGDLLERWFAAQCVKDDRMAEAIAAVFDGEGEPLVVHFCGSFHSNYGLGTVSRLLQRRPELKVAIVSSVRDDRTARELTELERERGDFVWLVKR